MVSQTTPDGATFYDYDGFNRLVSVETDAEKIDYTYDALDRCLYRKAFDKETEQIEEQGFVYDGLREIALYETDPQTPFICRTLAPVADIPLQIAIEKDGTV